MVNADGHGHLHAGHGLLGPRLVHLHDQRRQGRHRTATVSITVNDPPVANAQSVTLNQDTTSTVTLTGTDADNDPLRFKVTSLPANGKLYDGTGTGGHLIVRRRAALHADGHVQHGHLPAQRRLLRPRLVPVQGERRPGRLDRGGDGVDHGQPREPCAGGEQRLGRHPAGHAGHGQRAGQRQRPRQRHADGDRRVAAGPRRSRPWSTCDNTVTYVPDARLLRSRLVHLHGERRQRRDRVGHRVDHGERTRRWPTPSRCRSTRTPPRTVTLTGTDPDNDPLRFKITSLPANGKLYDGTGTGGHLIVGGRPALRADGRGQHGHLPAQHRLLRPRLVPVQGQRRPASTRPPRRRCRSRSTT